MLRRTIALFALPLLGFAPPAHAFEEYSAVGHGVVVEGKTPPQTAEGTASDSYNSQLSWKATADRGIFRSRSRLENNYVCHCTPQIFPGPDRAYSLFGGLDISGPAGQPASGVMHLKLEGKLEIAGEYPWRSSVLFQAYPGLEVYSGEISLDADGVSSNGALSGQASPTVIRSLDLPFTISEPGYWSLLLWIETYVGDTGYGSGYNMGSANFYDDLDGDGLGGLHFRTDGPAFTMSEGFVANSTYFGIVDNYWTGGTVGVTDAPAPAAKLSLVLGSNPVRTGTAVSYTVPRAGTVRLDVIDLQGRVVAVLEDGWREAGAHAASWAAARAVPTGLYFVRVALAGEQVVRKATVLE